MKTIAVTGAQGFVGSAIAKEILLLGYKVIPIVRQKNDAKRTDVIEWDITNPCLLYTSPSPRD